MWKKKPIHKFFLSFQALTWGQVKFQMRVKVFFKKFVIERSSVWTDAKPIFFKKAPEHKRTSFEMFGQHLQGSTELAGCVYSVNYRKGGSVLVSYFFSLPFYL